MYIVAMAADIASTFGTVIDFTVRRPRMVVGFINIILILNQPVFALSPNNSYVA
jgi:hypothetical protein